MHSVLLELLYLAKHTELVYFWLPILFGCAGSLLLRGLSLVAEHRLQDMQASVAVACGLSSCSSWTLEHRLNSCGTQALLLRGM